MTTCKTYLLSLFLIFSSFNFIIAQDVQVSTLIPDINASGGLTRDAAGNFYISDFGSGIEVDSNTIVYKIDKIDLSLSVFCDGFIGASGACFDSQGNFYQSNNNGNRVSKIHADGTKEYDWATEGFNLPIGIIADSEDNLFVCNCAGNNISKITSDGASSTFANSPLFKCPNGLTIDPDGNLYACNFSDGKILKITPNGTVSEFVELQTLNGGPNPVGNGHITYVDGYLYVTLIGIGQVRRICLEDGASEFIAGLAGGFSNIDGEASVATFSKPNGIISSTTGDTLLLNTSIPTWVGSAAGFHPGMLRMITGINNLPTDLCDYEPVSTQEQIPGLLFFKIIPNTVLNKKIAIQYQLENTNSLQFLLYNLKGQLLQSYTSPNTGKFNIEVPNLSPGVYILNMKTNKGNVSRKVSIQ